MKKRKVFVKWISCAIDNILIFILWGHFFYLDWVLNNVNDVIRALCAGVFGVIVWILVLTALIKKQIKHGGIFS